MLLPTMQTALAVASGSIVGFLLGLVGGGGSILAVPLLVYVVGLDNPHVAIGTSAIAVALNAAANLAMHARAGNVRWHCAIVRGSRSRRRIPRLDTRIAALTVAWAKSGPQLTTRAEVTAMVPYGTLSQRGNNLAFQR
jgi:hypothetical protein